MDEKQKRMSLTDEQAEQAAGGANPFLEAQAASAGGPVAETSANWGQTLEPRLLNQQVAPVTKGTIPIEATSSGRHYPVKFYTGKQENQIDSRAR